MERIDDNVDLSEYFNSTDYQVESSDVHTTTQALLADSNLQLQLGPSTPKVEEILAKFPLACHLTDIDMYTEEHIPPEEEIMEFGKPSRLGAPDLSWSVSVQISWSSPFITPCDMNWLARELADQIYHKKEENDQEREKDIMEIQEKQAEDFLQREERIDEFQEMEEIMEIQNEAFPIESDEVFKVESGGPFLKTSENLLFVSPNADDEEVNEEMVSNDTKEDPQNLLSQWLESSDGNKDIFLEEDEVSLVNMIEKEEPTMEEISDLVGLELKLELDPDFGI